MGICYNLILEDEWDWGYSETSKEEQLKKFEEEWKKTGGYIEKITEWYDFVVYDIDKSFPYNEERLKLIAKYCDNAYYTCDHSSGITKLDIPYSYTPSGIQYEDMENRRTPEEKKASEELTKQRLKELGY